MNRLIFLAAASAALAACGSNEADETPPQPVDTTATDTTANMDTATGNMTGTYEVQLADGTNVRQSVNSDGTYVDSDMDGNEMERGTWRAQGEQMCYDPDGAEPETCYSGGQAQADGTFQMRDADGNVTASVRKVDPTT